MARQIPKEYRNGERIGGIASETVGERNWTGTADRNMIREMDPDDRMSKRSVPWRKEDCRHISLLHPGQNCPGLLLIQGVVRAVRKIVGRH